MLKPLCYPYPISIEGVSKSLNSFDKIGRYSKYCHIKLGKCILDDVFTVLCELEALCNHCNDTVHLITSDDHMGTVVQHSTKSRQ